MSRGYHVNFTRLKYRAKKSKQAFSKEQIKAFKKWKSVAKVDQKALAKLEQELRRLMKLLSDMIESQKIRQELLQEIHEKVHDAVSDVVRHQKFQTQVPSELSECVVVRPIDTSDFPPVPKNLIDVYALLAFVTAAVASIALRRAAAALVHVVCQDASKKQA